MINCKPRHYIFMVLRYFGQNCIDYCLKLGFYVNRCRSNVTILKSFKHCCWIINTYSSYILLFIIIFKDIKGVNTKLKLKNCILRKNVIMSTDVAIFNENAIKYTDHDPLRFFYNNSFSYSHELIVTISITASTWF